MDENNVELARAPHDELIAFVVVASLVVVLVSALCQLIALTVIAKRCERKQLDINKRHESEIPVVPWHMEAEIRHYVQTQRRERRGHQIRRKKGTASNEKVAKSELSNLDNNNNNKKRKIIYHKNDHFVFEDHDAKTAQQGTHGTEEDDENASLHIKMTTQAPLSVEKSRPAFNPRSNPTQYNSRESREEMPRTPHNESLPPTARGKSSSKSKRNEKTSHDVNKTQSLDENDVGKRTTKTAAEKQSPAAVMKQAHIPVDATLPDTGLPLDLPDLAAKTQDESEKRKHSTRKYKAHPDRTQGSAEIA